MEAFAESDGDGRTCCRLTSMRLRREEKRSGRGRSLGGRRWSFSTVFSAVGLYCFAVVVFLVLATSEVTVEGHAGCSFHSHHHDQSHHHSHGWSHSHDHDDHHDHHHSSSSLAEDMEDPSDGSRASGIPTTTPQDRQNPFHAHDYAHGYRSLSQFPDEMDDYEAFHSKEEEDDVGDVDDELHPRGAGLWLRAMASSLAVSFASLICLALLPFIAAWGKGPSQRAVDLLAAFGVGAMLGDAFLHQLPHAFGSGGHSHAHDDHGHGHGHVHSHDHMHGHSHSHEHDAGCHHAHSLAELSVGLSVLVGIFLFFVVEKIVRRTEELGVSSSSHSRGHHHHHAGKLQKPSEPADDNKEAKGGDAESDKAQGEDGQQAKGKKGEGKGEEEDGKDVKVDGKKKGENEEDTGGSQKGCEKDACEGMKKNGNTDSNTEDTLESKGEEGERNRDETGSTTSGEAGSEGPADDMKTNEKGDDTMAEKMAEDTSVEKQTEGIRHRRKGGKTRSKTTDVRTSYGEVPDGSPAKADDAEVQDEEKKLKEGGQVVEQHAHMSTGVSASPSLAVLGYLNLFSDGVHNFTDGMALASAFLHHGSVGGWSRMLFILAHELPQEVGDFGILLRAGFSVMKALTLNFLSALLAMAGTAAVLVFGAEPGNSSLIEGFTAGGFIYLAVAGVIPDLHNQGNDLKTSVLQLAAMVTGVGIALVISLWE